MLYLTDKYDKDEKVSYSRDKHPKEYYEELCWLFFQNAGVGPMQGQANRTHVLLSNSYVRFLPLCTREDSIWNRSLPE